MCLLYSECTNYNIAVMTPNWNDSYRPRRSPIWGNVPGPSRPGDWIYSRLQTGFTQGLLPICKDHYISLWGLEMKRKQQGQGQGRPYRKYNAWHFLPVSIAASPDKVHNLLLNPCVSHLFLSWNGKNNWKFSDWIYNPYSPGSLATYFILKIKSDFICPTCIFYRMYFLKYSKGWECLNQINSYACFDLQIEVCTL